MPNELNPSVDQWYRPDDKGELLRVVAVDMDNELVEIQFFDGDVEELDLDAWRDMDIDLVDEPEDWTGPYDDLEADDLGDTEVAATGQDWHQVNTVANEEAWQDTRASDEREIEEGDRPVEPYVSEEKPGADL